jgi:hypothetical protein
MKLRMGLAVLVMCAVLSMTAVPAAADYTADKPLTTYASGTITGDMNYTIGDSYYSGKLWNDNDGDPATNDGDSYTVNLTPTLQPGALNYSARLYVYCTWSYVNDSNSAYNTGVNDTMNVTFNGTLLTLDRAYNDTKNDTAGNATSYNYPSGTYAYDVTAYVDATTSNTYVVNVTNVYPYTGDDANTNGDDRQTFAVQGVGLLTLYNKSFGTTKYYWIAEGNDLTYVKYDNTTTYSWKNDITPDDATALANFTGVSTSGVTSADLTTVVPSGGTPYNRLYVNYFFNYPAWGIKYWDGLWTANPYNDLSVDTTDVKDNLKDGTNYVGFQNGLYTMLPDNSEGQMQAANAFLLVKKS